MVELRVGADAGPKGEQFSERKAQSQLFRSLRLRAPAEAVNLREPSTGVLVVRPADASGGQDDEYRKLRISAEDARYNLEIGRQKLEQHDRR